MNCPSCGTPVAEGHDFCGKCGAQVRQLQSPPQPQPQHKETPVIAVHVPEAINKLNLKRKKVQSTLSQKIPQIQVVPRQLQPVSQEPPMSVPPSEPPVSEPQPQPAPASQLQPVIEPQSQPVTHEHLVSEIPAVPSAPPKKRGTSSLVFAILGLMSVFMGFAGMFFSGIGLILGIIGYSKSHKAGDPKGRVTAGIVLNIIVFLISIGVTVYLFMLILPLIRAADNGANMVNNPTSLLAPIIKALIAVFKK